jgi:CcmD family protein
MSGEMEYVAACYFITWLGLAVYALKIMLRVRKAEIELEER